MKSYVLLLFSVLVFITFTQAKIILRINHLPPVDPIAVRDGKTPIMSTIRQRVDHFNFQDLREWDMRYLSNDQFFTPGGPLIIFIGGEWAIDPNYLMTGQIFEMAQEHNGYLFYTEHRFYGESFPTANTSVPNMIYLTTDQTMADIITFINHMKSTVDGLQNSKVIVVGGSYAGTLAAWLRSKYPHVVDISYSSSAPMEAVANYKEYFEVVRNAFNTVSPMCLEILENSTKELESMLNSDAGISEASSLLNTCEKININEPYRTYLFTTVIAQAFAGMVQNGGAEEIGKACARLINDVGTSLERVAAYLKSEYNSTCISGHADFINGYSSTENADSLYRSWLYQTCTEFGFFQPTGPPFRQMDDISYHLKLCADIFGPGFGETALNNGITRTNLFYGGKGLQISQAIFVYGTFDPWHPLGILQNFNPTSASIVVNGTSHCTDLLSISPNDMPEILAAKTKVLNLVAEWLRH